MLSAPSQPKRGTCGVERDGKFQFSKIGIGYTFPLGWLGWEALSDVSFIMIWLRRKGRESLNTKFHKCCSFARIHTEICPPPGIRQFVINQRAMTATSDGIGQTHQIARKTEGRTDIGQWCKGDLDGIWSGLKRALHIPTQKTPHVPKECWSLPQICLLWMVNVER